MTKTWKGYRKSEHIEQTWPNWWRTMYPTMTNYTFISYAHSTFTKIHHMTGKSKSQQISKDRNNSECVLWPQ